jgi:AcrR family transcriptional regulator
VPVRAEGRVYGGRTYSERRAERRERLMDTGLDLFGTLGWAGTAVERLCQSAGVATRSFYEEFESRETLLLAVYERLMTSVSEHVVRELASADPDLTARVRTGLSAYIDYVTIDPRRARIVHAEVRSAGVLETERRAAFLSFAAIVEQESAELGRRGERREGAGRLVALALAGAVNELLIDWVATPEPRPETEPMVDELVMLFVRALRLS